MKSNGRSDGRWKRRASRQQRGLRWVGSGDGLWCQSRNNFFIFVRPTLRPALRPAVRPYGRNHGNTAIRPESLPAVRPYRQQYDYRCIISNHYDWPSTDGIRVGKQEDTALWIHVTVAILVCVRITTVHRSKSGLLCAVCASGEWNLFLLKIQGLHVSAEKCSFIYVRSDTHTALILILAQ